MNVPIITAPPATSSSTAPNNSASNSNYDVMLRIWAEMKSISSKPADDLKKKLKDELREHVLTLLQDLPSDAFSKLTNDLNRRIFDFINSQDPAEKLIAIYTIDSLLDLEFDENVKFTRFANYLRLLLPSADPNVTKEACRVIGRLASLGGTLVGEFVDFELKRAVEWIQSDRTESRRLASVLIIKELSGNAPTLVYPFVPQLFDLLLIVLKDVKLGIREAAFEALDSCLELVERRESTLKRGWYKKLFEDAQKGFKSVSVEGIHGSLLVLKGLLVHPDKYMESKYGEVADLILRYKEHREALIRKTVMFLIPNLAHFDALTFSTHYLDNCMTYILSQLKKEKERGPAFVAAGKVAMEVGSRVGVYLDAILACVKDGLIRRSKTPDPSIFSCISMLSVAVGPALTKYMHELLDLLFTTGLSDPLRKSLTGLATNIPPLLPTIQDRLLNMLSWILCGTSYKYPGSPIKPTANMFPDQSDTESIILALTTLGTFDFSGHSLNELVRDCALKYLDDENEVVRKAAVGTCMLLKRDPVIFETSNNSLHTVSLILEKLLMVGLTDSNPTIRSAVFSSLDEHFDFHLSQPENIRILFMAVNDEVFGVRELVISIIGRLSILNPGCVVPQLRRSLIMFLTELEYSVVSRQKEESAKLLGLLISSTHHLMKPYVEPILKVLLPKTKDPSPSVSSKILLVIAELAQIGGEDMIPHLEELMPMIMDTLQDQSSMMKRETALRTLGMLVSCTGWVVEPYLKYPQLLDLLINILKTESSSIIRRETVKVMGVIGALDPYKHKITLLNAEDSLSGSTAETVPLGLGPSSEEYFPTVAIGSLMKILRDTSLSAHHTAVVQAIMYIFKSLGLKCVPFLPQIMPPFFNMMQQCPVGILEFHFQQLALLVSIIKQHIRNYLNDLFALIQEFWNTNSNIQITILSLIEAIATALDGEFKVYLPTLLAQILQILETDTSEKKQPTQKVLQALVTFGNNLEEYLHLVVPYIVKLYERADLPWTIKKTAIIVTGQLCKKINFADYAGRIIHPLMRSMSVPEVRTHAMDTLCTLVYQLGPDFVVFVPMVAKTVEKWHIQHSGYELLVGRLLKNEPLPLELGGDNTDRPDPGTEDPIETSAKKLPVNQNQLKKAWETSQRSTRDDWNEWIRRFSVELLKESPSHALRACANLASIYYPLARELFNAGFVSCWGELYDQFQDELVRSLETALTSPTIPPEILQTLLNLAEFMEHDDKALPIDIRTLGAYAAKCHAYAKALHYKELEFISEPLTDTIEALISINNQLQQPDSAIGILTFAQQNHAVELKESWYEKLHRWEDGLFAYDRKLQEDPTNFDAMLGRMRCLHNLGEWEGLSEMAQDKWPVANFEARKNMAPLAAAAAWGTGQYDLMESYIAVMKQDSPDSAFFRAILALHRNLYPQAAGYIDKTRELLDTELMALVGESYNRAYNVVVRVQMLAEMEEIIAYKQLYDQKDRQETMRLAWVSRLKGCQRNVDVWQRILKVRSSVVSPKEDMDIYIKFSNLCRKSGRLNLSHKTLSQLLNTPSVDFTDLNLTTNDPPVIYACLKHLWSSGNRENAYTQMKTFTHTIAENLGVNFLNEHRAMGHLRSPSGYNVNLLGGTVANPVGFAGTPSLNAVPGSAGVAINPTQTEKLKLMRLLARCYLKLGEWHTYLADELNESVIPDILRSYEAATQCDKDWYKAWHAWALSNFEALTYYEKENDSVPQTLIVSHVVPSVRGFFRSIALSKNGNSLQDTLRLLTLWFKYGYQPDVNVAIGEGFNNVSIDTWLQVIPQLIARIHTPSEHVRKLIHTLLTDVGKEHPQALVYPLTVASKSTVIQRKRSALAILEKMRVHSAVLVEQAMLVSQELIRVAIIWHEIWHEGLEEASRFYFGDHNVEGMFTTLEPLHQMLERGPETLREISFNHAYGAHLHEALDWCKRYKRTLNINDLNQAWDLYYHVFRRINKQLPSLTTLELQVVSPKLLAANNLDLAVPGTYKSGEAIVRIASFVPTLNVFTSKQRPRKLGIKGSDGKEYQYLLKGHEDLRQDERVMQLFGLVNTLLATDAETFKRHLGIEQYPVIPLSPNSGLIGWVPHCDTLHALIRDYRESRKILFNIEHRLMLQMAPDYDNLTLLEKVEVFEYALENTTGQDLYKVLWLKSKNSEVWLDRRTNYTRSLAVMSMAGYILGLGDRHPSNLMLHRFTGKVIHVDFGDCFEVAMNREKFPEKIPFRLTRMLINAMEVSGIEGNFRITCGNVMRVLRENKESVMAVLEAFVYDPLINWRLVTNASPKQDKPQGRKLDSEMDEPVLRANRRLQKNENDLIPEKDDAANKPDNLTNARALTILNRVSAKLTGRDFKPNVTLSVTEQVQRLILQATSLENLCQCFIGWCAFW